MRNAALLLILCGCQVEDPGPRLFKLVLENTSEPGALVASDDSTHDIKLAPAIVIVHTADFALFTPGEAASVDGFEALAEDGDPSGLEPALQASDAVSTYAFLTKYLDGTYDSAPLFPGESIEATVTVPDADHRVTVAFMFGESNDVLVSTDPAGLALYDQTDTVTLTADLALWDAGTELNEEPGLGAYQAPRQQAAGEGDDENGTVERIDGTDAAGFSYPAPAEMLTLQASPQPVLEQ